MSSLADVSKTDLAKRYENLRATVRRVREDSRHAAKLGTAAILTTAGAFTGGYLSTQSSLATLPGTTVPTDAAVGVALIAGCALDMFDSANDNVAAFAGGLLAAAAHREGVKFGLARLSSK